MLLRNFYHSQVPPQTWDILSSFVILVLQALFGNLLLSKSWVMTRTHLHLQAAGLFNEGRHKKGALVTTANKLA